MSKKAHKHIDLTIINKNYQNNITKRNILLRLYLDGMKSELNELKEFIDKDDKESIHLKSHSIKTLMIQLGIQSLFENMLYIEKNSHISERNLLYQKLIETMKIWNEAALEIETELQQTS